MKEKKIVKVNKWFNMNLKADNHYIPQSLLKNWAIAGNKVWCYRTLVSHNKVPLWKPQPIKSIAKHKHLYTQILSNAESDDFERQFDSEFESPAGSSISKAIAGKKLSKEDWYRIIQYTALQDIRTPARLMQHLNMLGKTLPDVMEETLKDLKHALENGTLHDDSEASHTPSNEINFPLKVTQTPDKSSGEVHIGVHTVPGRATWLHSIQQALHNTVKYFHNNRWTIMRPARGLYWPTSDNPVIRLNYYTDRKYNFDGGWGNEGSEILFPLGPEHLLYTRVGSKPPLRGTRFDIGNTKLIKKFIAESAYRLIFSNERDDNIAILRPRCVDQEKFRKEKALWSNWHAQQSSIERDLSG